MINLASPDDLKEYCFRKLGKPVVNIEVAPEQAADRIDDALGFFIDYHFDGAQESFIKITFTEADAIRQTIKIPKEIVSITEIYDPQIDVNAGGSADDFDRLNYLIAQSDYFDFTGVQGRDYDLLSYDLTMQYISLMQMYFTVRRSFYFNKVMGTLNVPSGKIVAGNWILVRGHIAVNPDKSPNIFNDEWVKRYAVQLMKLQWGENLKKYEGVQMVGGVTLNGQKIWDEAQAAIEKLETEFRLRYEAPAVILWG